MGICKPKVRDHLGVKAKWRRSQPEGRIFSDEGCVNLPRDEKGNPRRATGAEVASLKISGTIFLAKDIGFIHRHPSRNQGKDISDERIVWLREPT